MNDSARNWNGVIPSTSQGAIAKVKLGLGNILRSDGEVEGVGLLFSKRRRVACGDEFSLMINGQVRDVIHRIGNIVRNLEVNKAVLAFGHIYGELLGVITHIGQ